VDVSAGFVGYAAEITIMHYWFGQAFFYFQGNSNNIATVDVSAGFVGLDTYMEVPAMFLTAFATFAGPVLWASHLVSFLSSETSSSALGHACFCYALICSFPVSAYIILVTSLRYHLFIWSVFSPNFFMRGCISSSQLPSVHSSQPWIRPTRSLRHWRNNVFLKSTIHFMHFGNEKKSV